MRTVQTTLSGRDVQEYCQDLLQRRLRLKDHSPKCKASRLYSILLYVAATAGTIAQACRTLKKAPSDQTVYNALEETLPERLELQRRLNQTLADTLPKAVRTAKRSYPVAIDLVLHPYYGKPDPTDDQVYRGQEKAGTYCHHAYATIYLVRKGRRFTLAMRSVRHDDDWDEIVRWLLRQAKRLVPAIRLVLLDRGFYSVAVIRYLQRARYPFIMPAMRRGRKGDDGRAAGGTQPFFRWKKSGWAKYTLQANTQRKRKAGQTVRDQRATVDLAVKVRRPPKKRPGKKHSPKRVLVYACWGLRGRDPKWVDQAYQSRRVQWVKETYRKRFGIETSYRQLNQARGWTTSRSPVRRLLLVGLALLLRNVWALLHLVGLARRRRGGPQLRPELLPLADMLTWIAEALRQLLGLRDRLEVEYAFNL